MKTSRMALYVVITLIMVVVAYHFLASGQSPGSPMNLIHVLTSH